MKKIVISIIVFTIYIITFVSARSMNVNVEIPLKCESYTRNALPIAAPQTDPEAISTFDRINKDVKYKPHSILFLGDSLTQKFDPEIWRQYFAPRGALNAGVNGDRTENLLWRLRHGNLGGPPPNAVVVLIGTNDIGRNRSPETVAEGIRAILMLLRSQLPSARILLLGILPRNELPTSRRRYQVHEVNRLIQKCDDEEHVFYRDIGNILLDPGRRLTRAISRDGVHLSRVGYSRLAVPLAIDLDRVLDAGRPARGRQTR